MKDDYNKDLKQRHSKITFQKSGLDQKRLIGKVDFEERKRFIDWLLSKELSDRTINNYLDYYYKFISATNMNQKKINSFLKRYKYNSVAKAFINNYRTFILTNKEDYSLEIINNTKDIIIQKRTGRKPFKIPEYATEQEVLKAENFMHNERDKLMLLLSFYCGLRVGGLLNIKPYDFLWDEWDSTEKSGKKGQGKLKVLEKGKKERFVYVNPTLMDRIDEWFKSLSKIDLEKNECIFTISHERWWTILNSCSERAGISHLHAHKLRHGFGAFAAKKKVSIEKTQKFMGHKNISDTQRYYHISQEDLEEEAKKLDPGETLLK